MDPQIRRRIIPVHGTQLNHGGVGPGGGLGQLTVPRGHQPLAVSDNIVVPPSITPVDPVQLGSDWTRWQTVEAATGFSGCSDGLRQLGKIEPERRAVRIRDHERVWPLVAL
jgi:hypothetical protein